jgi:hypothetical protein
MQKCKHGVKEIRVRHELPAKHAIHLPAARAIRKIKLELGSELCSHPRRLHRLGRRRTERKCKCAVCSIATAAEFGIGGAHLTFGWRLCALHCERAAGWQAGKSSLALAPCCCCCSWGEERSMIGPANATTHCRQAAPAAPAQEPPSRVLPPPPLRPLSSTPLSIPAAE